MRAMCSEDSLGHLLHSGVLSFLDIRGVENSVCLHDTTRNLTEMLLLEQPAECNYNTSWTLNNTRQVPTYCIPLTSICPEQEHLP